MSFITLNYISIYGLIASVICVLVAYIATKIMEG
jgi:hypothetical protein